MANRILTGDTPTGKLHLGHYVGSLQNRIKLQEQYDTFILIANIHALTTRADKTEEISQSVIDLTLDYLASGIDPNKSTIFVQSDIPAISELTYLFSMLIPYPRVMRNPTLKDEIKDKELGDHYPFGFLLYPIGQIADILAFKPELVPVGEDQLPHLEMTKELARKFNSMYANKINNQDSSSISEILPIIKPLLSEGKRLVGTGPPNDQGKLVKMSKSLNNAIYLSDDNDTIKTKIMKMYTDPNRLRASDPGNIDNNPLWLFHDIFNNDKQWVEQAKERYKHGDIGDVECKKKLVEVLVELIEPIRTKREEYAKDISYVQQILNQGADKANQVAEQTLSEVKQAMNFR